jgi:FSR family fosmidomycin resistance protein-like MFS transporter
MGLWMTAGETARALGPLAAVGAVAWLGFEGSWPIMALGLVASLLLYGALAGHTTVNEKTASLSAGKDFAEAWHGFKGYLGPLTLLVLPRLLVANTLMNYLPTFLVSRGHSLWFGGMALTLLEVAGIVGTFLGGTLSDRLGRRMVLLGSLALSPPLLFALVHLQGWAALLVLAPLGIISFTGAPVTMALVQDLSAGRRGAANGIYMGLNFVTAAVVVLAVGRMVDLWGFDTALTINAALALCCLPAVWLLPSPEKK